MKNRDSLIKLINSLLDTEGGIIESAYNILYAYILEQDKELAEEMGAKVHATDGFFYLSNPLSMNDPAEDVPPEIILPPVEAARLTPEARDILGELQDFFYVSDGVVDVDKEDCPGSDCVDICIRLMTAMGLDPVRTDEHIN